MRNDAPALSDRIDFAIITRAGSKWSAVIEVRAPVPFAIPRRGLDGFPVILCLISEFICGVVVTASVDRGLPNIVIVLSSILIPFLWFAIGIHDYFLCGRKPHVIVFGLMLAYQFPNFLD